MAQSLTFGISWTIDNPLVVANPSAPAPAPGVPYSYQFQITGGTGPYNFSIISGTPPNGIMLSPSGLLSGTTTQSGGPYNFGIKVLDSAP